MTSPSSFQSSKPTYLTASLTSPLGYLDATPAQRVQTKTGIFPSTPSPFWRHPFPRERPHSWPAGRGALPWLLWTLSSPVLRPVSLFPSQMSFISEIVHKPLHLSSCLCSLPGPNLYHGRLREWPQPSNSGVDNPFLTHAPPPISSPRCGQITLSKHK